jgi:hypothetical protein
MADERRKGDERPLKHDQSVSLTLTPAEGQPFRWLPRHGQPSCIGEWATQHTVRFLAWLPVYIGLIVTLILVIQVWNPFGLGE